ncbi:DUF1273 family protein [Nostocales cyanobacterium LEGE 11386]|nr:DUF1273 family protein [Nostocales cyanobacterium LEGE 11386]
MTKIIAGTGHRPEKLGGYSNKVFTRLVALCQASLERLQPDQVISGMALGFDQALATAAIELNIPLIAAIPFEGQECKWNHNDQVRYDHLLMCSTRIICVDKMGRYADSNSGYSAVKMQKRNEYMIDNCTKVLALYDGSSGGTGNCIKYAKSQNKPVLNVWNSWVKYKGF